MHIASSTPLQSTTPRAAPPPNCADKSPVSPQLSAREREILKWCAMGKSSWEIARILARSEAGVNYHIGNILRKFGVSSRLQALVKAPEMGLIELKDREGTAEARQPAPRKKGRGSSVSSA